MTHYRARAALLHPVFCGLGGAHLGVLIEELADPWLGRCESELRERRGGERKRAAGARPDHRLVFTDRVLVTVAHLRLQLPHAALAELYGVTRPTNTRAIHEIRPLLRPVAHRPSACAAVPGLGEGSRWRGPGAPDHSRRPAAGSAGPGTADLGLCAVDAQLDAFCLGVGPEWTLDSNGHAILAPEYVDPGGGGSNGDPAVASWASSHYEISNNGFGDDCTDFVSRALFYGGGFPKKYNAAGFRGNHPSTSDDKY
ncbi:transposase family protein [Streptomyces sp. NBC_01231]|nr:transposase family protein [Streptomyces sp. NBC_01231]